MGLLCSGGKMKRLEQVAEQSDQSHEDRIRAEKIKLMEELGMAAGVSRVQDKFPITSWPEVEAKIKSFFAVPVDVTQMSLTEWSEDVPYGVLLRVKEAKDAGLYDFSVCYPTVAGKRPKGDPIIIARQDEPEERQSYRHTHHSGFWTFVFPSLVCMRCKYPTRGWREVAAWDDGKVYD